MRTKGTNAEVGVIVGRFQVPNLHDAHIELIKSVCDKHSRVLVFLGLSQCLVTKNNPLDFEARKQMLLQSFPDINVLYIKDCQSDEIWSRKLDEQIRDLIGPNQNALLYGSRDCFIQYYSGNFPTQELESTTYISGTEIRNSVGNKVKACPEFRAGVIWAAYNQYPKVHTTVDVAIFNEDKSKLLLARKAYEQKYRFVGGFSVPTTTCFEADARREVQEEAGIAITDPLYISSALVDDWRYRHEGDKIKTILFAAKIFSGRPQAGDDVAEVRWFAFDGDDKKKALEALKENIVDEHKPLVDMLIKKIDRIVL